MNLCRLLLLALLLVPMARMVYGQPDTKAILLDAFGKLECEDVIARQDHLFAELQRNPNSIGYAIIFTDEENRSQGRRIEAMFNGQTEFRRFDDSRFQVKRAARPKGIKVELWIVPAGAHVPEFTETGWDFVVDPKRQSFKINASDYDEGPCPIGSQFRFFSDYIKTNRHVRGHIVIWAKSEASFRKERKRVERELIVKYNLHASRIRYFYFSHQSPYIKWEHWIVPGRNR